MASQDWRERLRDDEMKKDKEQAARLRKIARESTPEQYRHFIANMPKTKSYKLPGDRDRNSKNIKYQRLELPYLEVTGQTKMARDEHKEAGATLSITFKRECLTDKYWTCEAHVSSSIYGMTSGIQQIRFGGSGADSTHPLETAESKALGRALRFMGYGLFAGEGITDDIEIDESADEPRDIPDMTGSKPESTVDEDDLPEPATPTELAELAKWLSQCGVKGKYMDALVEAKMTHTDGKIYRSTIASWIDYLQNQIENEDSTLLQKNLYAAYLKILQEASTLAPKEVAEFISTEFKKERAIELDADEQKRLFEYIIKHEKTEA